MSPATTPRSPRAIRVLGVDARDGAIRVRAGTDVAALFSPGDLLVVNDAATLPASLSGHTREGEPVELRLASSLDDDVWLTAAFGRGDFRTKTEDRPPPPSLAVDDEVRFGEGLSARVVRVRPESPRLVEVRFAIDRVGSAGEASAIWSALYRVARPVQYAYVPAPLALWDVQNAYAGRPWAVEMPSAGRALRAETLLELGRRGVEVARLTHAAGLSSIGDAALDALLPLPERYDIPEETVRAIGRARRVIAVGTSVVRALEGSTHDAGGRLAARSGVTSYLLGPTTRRRIVDALLTGVHEAETSHFTLLRAFAPSLVLERALAAAQAAGLLGHEFGDAWLVSGRPAARDVLGAPPTSWHPPRRSVAGRTSSASEMHQSVSR